MAWFKFNQDVVFGTGNKYKKDQEEEFSDGMAVALARKGYGAIVEGKAASVPSEEPAPAEAEAEKPKTTEPKAVTTKAFSGTGSPTTATGEVKK